MVTYNYPPTAIDTTGLATSANQVLIITELQDVNTELNTQTTALADVNTELNTQTTALADVNTELDTQTTALADVNTELNSQTAILTTIDADTGNIATSTASIDSKTPALGQALAAASVPVVLTAAQISTLTPQTDALTDTQLRASPVPISAASLPLPAGASTSALQTTGNSSLSSIDGKVPANLTVTATRLLVDGSGVTQPVSGTVTANAGTGTFAVSGPLTDAELRATPVPVSGTVTANAGTGDFTITQATAGNLNATVVGSGNFTVTQATAGNLNATVTGTVAATQSGTWTLQPGNTQNTTAWLTQEEKSATATLANISGATSSTTLQASNTARKGWTVHNDSTSILYVKFGSAASSTSYTVKLVADAYYELPTTSVYTGIITGIWVSATGSARATELS